MKVKSTKYWLKENLFNGPINSLISLIIIGLVIWLGIPLFKWFFINSVWNGTADTCREASGACLAFIREKFRFILFGFYPKAEVWRPALSVFLFCTMLFYSRDRSRWSHRLVFRWIGLGILFVILIRGGVFGFSYIDSSQWGGLPLTLMLATFGLLFSYPMGIILALGRRSNMPFIKWLCVAYIEFIRGIPLISVLFMSSVMFPLFLPEGVVIDKLLRAQVAIIMFVAAYMAEVVRGGLQALPKGQYEAAESLGLNYFQTMRLIILPQALKIVIPPTVNTAIGMFKDTSLVIIIALFDLMYTTKASLQDSKWLGFSIEGYIFIAIIYFIFCFSMSRYSQRLERELNRSAQ